MPPNLNQAARTMLLFASLAGPDALAAQTPHYPPTRRG